MGLRPRGVTRCVFVYVEVIKPCPTTMSIHRRLWTGHKVISITCPEIADWSAWPEARSRWYQFSQRGGLKNTLYFMRRLKIDNQIFQVLSRRCFPTPLEFRRVERPQKLTVEVHKNSKLNAICHFSNGHFIYSPVNLNQDTGQGRQYFKLQRG